MSPVAALVIADGLLLAAALAAAVPAYAERRARATGRKAARHPRMEGGGLRSRWERLE